MKYVQVRIFLLGVILCLIGLAYYEWHRALQTLHYSPKVAVLGPFGITLALYVLILPTRLGKPDSAGEKKAIFAVMALGTVAGLANLYLIDPSMFGR